MAIFTHELGHVLGYGHTTATCSLMSAVLDISACHLPPTSPAGYHKCRTIDAPLVRRFVKRYGGRAHLPAATWCLIDPMPSALTGVSFSGGVDSPVTVRWTKPTTVPTGSKVEIRMWPGEDVHGHAGVGRHRPGRADSPAVAGRPGPDERDVLLPGQARQPLRRRPGCGRQPDVALDAALHRAGRRDAVGVPG